MRSAPGPGPGRTTPLAAERPHDWGRLSPGQKEALKPLASIWGSLGDLHRRKWLELSRNYPTMTPAERATLHSRMTDWAILSPQERAQARLNFGETRRLPPSTRKAQWEAYQALTPEEKKRLADSRLTPPRSVAPAVRPEPAAPRISGVPELTAHSRNAPTVVIPSQQLDPRTLLPLRPASAPIGRP